MIMEQWQDFFISHVPTLAAELSSEATELIYRI